MSYLVYKIQYELFDTQTLLSLISKVTRCLLCDLFNHERTKWNKYGHGCCTHGKQFREQILLSSPEMRGRYYTILYLPNASSMLPCRKHIGGARLYNK